MKVAHTPGLQLSLAHHTIGTLERGCAPSQGCTITLPFSGSDPIYYCGGRLEVHHCPVMLPGEEFEALSQDSHSFINIVVDQNLLNRESLLLSGMPFSSHIQQKKLFIRRHDQQTLAQTVTAAMAVLNQESPTVRDIELLQKQLVEQLLLSIRSPDSSSPDTIPGCRLVAWRAERIIRKNLHRRLDIKELSKIIGCSLRTLHLGFKERYGITPARYGRILALQAVRRELSSLSPNLTIADVAMAWGFHHLGRFSRQYRELFGQLPRATVDQTRQRHSAHCLGHETTPPASTSPLAFPHRQ